MAVVISTEQVGTTYLIPTETNFIVGQVCKGGDICIFRDMISSKKEVKPGDILFRVHFGRVSPRKFHWKFLGVLAPLNEAILRSQPYRYEKIGTNDCWIVEDGKEDTKVDCEKIRNLERLATWSHEHIVKRYLSGGVERFGL